MHVCQSCIIVLSTSLYGNQYKITENLTCDSLLKRYPADQLTTKYPLRINEQVCLSSLFELRDHELLK
jgi:hypothetical protein